MTQQVLILGGRGRIGSHVAQDIANHTDAKIIITGRSPLPEKTPPQLASEQIESIVLKLEDEDSLEKAIAQADLVIHCAGPFHFRDGRVLNACIKYGKNYIDVSDHRSFYNRVVTNREEAEQAGITVVLNTGIFPGISNSMVKQGVEAFDDPQRIHLSYIVAGSGGAGVTVMRTTFLGLQNPFEALIEGKWQQVKPYSDRETIDFPEPFGKTGVYWFDMPETYTFAESFNVDTVITKFGSIPDLYNHLTWITAHVFPSSWVKHPAGVEFFAHVSHKMTQVTDKYSGIGVAMRSEIRGIKDGEEKALVSTMTHKSTAIAAGAGTGSVAQLILAGKLHQPGIYPIEQTLPTPLFQETMAQRGIAIQEKWLDVGVNA
jgi:saccharopine dehydrogenase-like NADP-dependent oxidoreductase